MKKMMEVDTGRGKEEEEVDGEDDREVGKRER